MVWTERLEQVELEALVADGPVLLVFYLFDWSPT